MWPLRTVLEVRPTGRLRAIAWLASDKSQIFPVMTLVPHFPVGLLMSLPKT